jgi:hypothetical protein
MNGFGYWIEISDFGDNFGGIGYSRLLKEKIKFGNVVIGWSL